MASGKTHARVAGTLAVAALASWPFVAVKAGPDAATGMVPGRWRATS